MIAVGDIVRLLDYDKNSLNSHARVTEIVYDTKTGNLLGYKVSNLNMPFNGLLNNKFVSKHRVKQ
jgi:hypothetical protein